MLKDAFAPNVPQRHEIFGVAYDTKRSSEFCVVKAFPTESVESPFATPMEEAKRHKQHDAACHEVREMKSNADRIRTIGVIRATFHRGSRRRAMPSHFDIPETG